MPSVVQLVRRGEARRAAPDDRHLPAASVLRDPGLHPAVLKRRLNDIELIIVDRDRIAVHAADAGLLAERGADPAGKLWEITGLEEP